MTQSKYPRNNIFIIGPILGNISTPKACESINRQIELQRPQLIIFLDAAVNLKEYLNISTKSFSLGDADGKVEASSDMGDEDYSSELDKLYPTEKDQSDLALALEYLSQNLEINPKENYQISLFGLWGGCFDHQLANIGELSRFDLLNEPDSSLNRIEFFEIKDIKMNRVAIIFNERVSLTHNGLFSLFCLQPSQVSMEGEIKYPLSKKTELGPLSSHGLSNEAHGNFKVTSTSPSLILLTE